VAFRSWLERRRMSRGDRDMATVEWCLAHPDTRWTRRQRVLVQSYLDFNEAWEREIAQHPGLKEWMEQHPYAVARAANSVRQRDAAEIVAAVLRERADQETP
jgi:hypothetical protein